MKPWIVLVGGVVASGLLAVAFFTRSDDTAEGGRAPDPELAALRSEVQALKKSSGTTRVYHINAADPSVAAMPAEPMAMDPVERADPEDTEDRQRRTMERHREIADALAVRLASEPVDSDWSTKTVHQIRDVIDTRATGSQLQEAECGSSLCRVVLTHDTAQAQTGISNVVAMVEPFAEGVLYDYDYDSQPPTTTLYVVRPGHTFHEDTEAQVPN